MIRKGVSSDAAEKAIKKKLSEHGFVVKSSRTVKSWREKLQEGEPSAPPACVKIYRIWGEGSVLWASYNTPDEAKQGLLAWLAGELEFRGYARR